MSGKLKLNDLAVQSFVTTSEGEDFQTVKGGGKTVIISFTTNGTTIIHTTTGTGQGSGHHTCLSHFYTECQFNSVIKCLDTDTVSLATKP